MTDEELNEIASRLRRTANDSPGGESLQKALARITVAEDVSWRGVMRRIADLIEPAPERTCHMIDNGAEFCCSVCDRRHDYDDEPQYCMGCGARVVSE